MKDLSPEFKRIYSSIMKSTLRRIKGIGWFKMSAIPSTERNPSLSREPSFDYQYQSVPIPIWFLMDLTPGTPLAVSTMVSRVF
jgi:hypothetical protein